jgi:hypothetical protein
MEERAESPLNTPRGLFKMRKMFDAGQEVDDARVWRKLYIVHLPCRFFVLVVKTSH